MIASLYQSGSVALPDVAGWAIQKFYCRWLANCRPRAFIRRLQGPTLLAGGNGENLKLDESCILNPKSEIANWTHGLREVEVQSAISDFGFEMQDLSNFKSFLDRILMSRVWAGLMR